MKAKYCDSCGRKLIKVRAKGFDKVTGKPLYDIVCPKSEAAMSTMGFGEKLGKIITGPFTYHEGDYGVWM